MDEDRLQELLDLKADYEAAVAQAEKARVTLERAIAYAQQDGVRGDQSVIAKNLDRSRESLRRAARKHRRLTLRRTEGRLWVTTPPGQVHDDTEYEIRDSDEGITLAYVAGRHLVRLHAEQGLDPLGAGENSVEVSELLK